MADAILQTLKVMIEDQELEIKHRLQAAATFADLAQTFYDKEDCLMTAYDKAVLEQKKEKVKSLTLISSQKSDKTLDTI